jgi:glycosyltransferase involved in cell wall biosynthesis
MKGNKKFSKEKISVIFPVYNEEFIIEKTIRSYFNELNGKVDFELIIAEDGSTDGTKKILDQLKKELPIKIYCSDERKGYMRAIIDASKCPKYDWVFLVDSDFQFNPKDFWKLFGYINQYDIILGIKEKRQDGLLRLLLSKIFNLILRILFKVPYSDMDTGFRLINKKCIDKVLNEVHLLKCFTAEFVIRSYFHGFKIK